MATQKCKKCGHEWESKIADPKRCPSCSRTDWQKPIVQTYSQKCLKCGWTWEARLADPALCPHCKSSAWRYPPGTGVRTGERRAALGERTASPEIAEEPGQEVDEPVEMCEHRELDSDSGEWVYCALPKHPGKIKHVPGKREAAR